MAIRQWPRHQRPREKLLIQGAKALSNAELLAIFLRTGVQGLFTTTDQTVQQGLILTTPRVRCCSSLTMMSTACAPPPP